MILLFGFLQNPSAVNQNGVLAANNQPEPIDSFLYPGLLSFTQRQSKKTQLVEPKSSGTAVGEMIFEANTSSSCSRGG
jgi:penicillin amidase